MKVKIKHESYIIMVGELTILNSDSSDGNAD